MVTLCFNALLNVEGLNAAVKFNNVMVAKCGRGLVMAIPRYHFFLTLGQPATIPWVPKSSTISDLHAGVSSLIRKMVGDDADVKLLKLPVRADVLFVLGKMTEKQ
jgi:hypothetical protein